MKTVLLPTDFSDNSKNAVNWAVQFYQNEKVNFILLHSYFSPQAGTSSVVSINEILRKQALADLKDYKEELERKFKNSNHTYKYEAVYGDVLHAIKTVTKGNDNIAVVVGAKGMSAMEEIFVGSNTSALVKEADAPVFVIPENVVYKEIKKIALAIDFRENMNAASLAPLKNLLEIKKAELRVFYVEDDEVIIKKEQEEKTINDLKLKLDKLKVEVIHINEDDVLSGVQKFIHSHNIDLLVTVNRKKTFFESLFHKSFSKQVALHTDTPLMVLHD